MRGIVRFAPADAAPEARRALARAGVPESVEPPPRTLGLLADAVRLFHSLAEPRAIVAEVAPEAFAAIHRGDGRNDPETALDRVAPSSRGLFLFAATLGDGICGKIGELVSGADLPLGFVLDAVASEAADGMAAALAGVLLERLARDRRANGGMRVLPYSPGYCGWHVSGQRALFDALEPRAVGITLNASCLMSPMKSVSGVLVAGSAATHRFRPDLPSCVSCRTHECRSRTGPALDAPPPPAKGSAEWTS